MKIINILLLIILLNIYGVVLPSNTEALLTPHPMQIYEKGKAIINAYQGDTSQLAEAQIYFTELIEKYPDSHLGYLGMSNIHRIDAYHYDNHYNMKSIKKDALPFALKALEIGASLKEVHENFSIFEKIFDDYDKAREDVQEYLYLFPDSAQTYFALATLLRDQAEYEKSVEYFKKALDLNPPENLRVKILKRIGIIYLDEFSRPEIAAEYYKQALEINNDSPVINEYLGISYLKMEKYKLSIEKLKKSLESINTSFQEYHLLEAKAFLSEESGNIPQAIGYLEEASRHKKSSLINYNLGNLYYKINNYEKAYYYFKQVIDLSPHISKAYYFAGRSMHSLGNADIAIDYYKKYLKMNSDGIEAEWIRKNIPDLSQK